MLELYGDYGNIQVLKYRIESRGYKVTIDRYSIGDPAPDFNSYDIVFAGGGADNEQSILSEDLIQYKENIKEAVENGVFFLLICGAYQLFGKYYKSVEGNIIPGLEIFDYYTEANPDRKQRCIGNIIIEVKLKSNQNSNSNENIKIFGLRINHLKFHQKFYRFYSTFPPLRSPHQPPLNLPLTRETYEIFNLTERKFCSLLVELPKPAEAEGLSQLYVFYGKSFNKQKFIVK